MTRRLRRTFTGTLLASGLAAAAAAAQESAPRVAPALAQYTDEVLFGEVWRGDELSARDRSLVVIAALVASGKAAQLAGHTGRALDNGLTPVEVGEIVTHLAFYSGWPNAVSAAAVVDEVFSQRGIAPTDATGGAPIALDEAGEAARAATSGRPSPPTRRGWRGHRPRRVRRPLAPAAAFRAGPEPRHGGRPRRDGRGGPARLPPEPGDGRRPLGGGGGRRGQSHLAYHVGWPRAFSAVPVLRDVAAGRS